MGSDLAIYDSDGALFLTSQSKKKLHFRCRVLKTEALVSLGADVPSYCQLLTNNFYQ